MGIRLNSYSVYRNTQSDATTSRRALAVLKKVGSPVKAISPIITLVVRILLPRNRR